MARTRRRLSPRVRWALAAVLGVVLLWLIAVTVLMFLARREVDRGLAELQQARREMSPTALVRGEGRAALGRAKDDFARAHDLTSNPFIAPLKVTPVLGRQARSIDAMTRGARDVVDAGQQAISDAQTQLRTPPPVGTGRIALMAQLEGTAARAERRMRSVDLGPDSRLLRPIADARREFADRLGGVRKALGDARTVAQGLSQFLQGPRKYLVLGANNGEMRAGSGMLLQAGVLSLEGGRFQLGPMQPTADLHLPPGAVPVTGDFADRWGFLEPTQEWRNLAATPRFDVTGSLAAQMWQAKTGEAVDGVLALDPFALQALLAAEGPVQASDRAFSSTEVVGYILFGQYQDFPVFDPTQQARRDVLSGIARAAVDGLDTRAWKPADVADQLRTAARGRHVLAWSRDAVEQRAWTAAGISGELHTGSSLVAVLNMGGNKLDQFLAVTATVRSHKSGHSRAVAIQVQLKNNAPQDGVRYVIGPFTEGEMQPGEYNGYLSVNVPGTARNVYIEGASKLVAAGADGPTRVVAAPVQLQRGANVVLTVRFEVPQTVKGFEAEPSARFPAVQWADTHGKWSDTTAHRVAF